VKGLTNYLVCKGRSNLPRVHSLVCLRCEENDNCSERMEYERQLRRRLAEVDAMSLLPARQTSFEFCREVVNESVDDEGASVPKKS